MENSLAPATARAPDAAPAMAAASAMEVVPAMAAASGMAASSATDGQMMTAEASETARTGTGTHSHPDRGGYACRAARALLVLTLVLPLALVLSACGVDEVSDGKAEHRDFPLKGSRLTVVADDGRVDLVPVPRRSGVQRVGVTRWFKAAKVKGTARAEWRMENGHTLRLKSTCSGFIVDCVLHHRVEVPRDVAVSVRSKEGRVVAGDFSAPLAVRTTGGNINISGTTGPLALRTSDGNIRAERLRSPSLRAHTREGYLILSFTRPPDLVRTRTHEGSTTLTVPPSDYRIRAHSTVGRVRVSVPRHAKAPRTLDAASHAGTVSVRGS